MKKFKKLDKNIIQPYMAYLRAYLWDYEKQCFPYVIEPISYIVVDDNYGLYLNHKLIGYGAITNINSDYFNDSPEDIWFQKIINSDSGQKKAELSLIINPKYQHCGYGKEFLDLLIQEASLAYDSVIVWALKENEKSISLIEKSGFDFLSFDEEKIVFEKKFKNR